MENSHPHDAIIPLKPEDYAEVLGDVDLIMADVNREGSVNIGLRYAKMYVRGMKVAGLALANLLWQLQEWWDANVTLSQDSFDDMAGAKLNLASATVRRWRRTWYWVIVHPDHDKERTKILLTKPAQGLYALVSPSKEGLMTEEAWKSAEKATNKGALEELRRELQGISVTGDNRLMIMLERDGTIKARKGDQHYRAVGVLNIDDEDETVQAAVERITRKAGVFER